MVFAHLTSPPALPCLISLNFAASLPRFPSLLLCNSIISFSIHPPTHGTTTIGEGRGGEGTWLEKVCVWMDSTQSTNFFRSVLPSNSFTEVAT
mmetsp:Transcript_34753/g.56295  ORF Transcript_34753/g.56295 Transcript_34753/m.56295 type:complete len:93 (+) Transcript_34753:91-369(+)